MTTPGNDHWLRGCLIRFMVIFTLLILPWPGADELYGSYFRAFASAAFSRDDSPREVRFYQGALTHGFTTLNTRILLANRSVAAGHRAVQTDLDSRSIGWVPTALTLSLILATPLPWRRKLGAALAGLVLIHLLIAFTIGTWIWSESGALQLSHPTGWEQRVLEELRHTFLTQLGSSFSGPVVIWLLVCFRRQDASLLLGKPPSAA